jgi:MFS family permease
MGRFARPVEILAGVLMGFAVGFIFPAISADSVKVHSGFNLYNMGFAGGIVATVLATGYRNLGMELIPAQYWSSGNNTYIAALLYGLALMMVLIGFLSGTAPHSASGPGEKLLKKERIRRNLSGFRKVHGHSGRLLTDFYHMYEDSIYINMGVLCAFGTTLVLILRAELSGPAIAGILTMTGFGALGKHMRNVTPVILGAILSDYVNNLNPSAPVNIIAILFSTGLAPIAGTYGWLWGVAAGFLHVNIATYIGDLNIGLNLYNNGFAASFVVMFLLPVITIFKKGERY